MFAFCELSLRMPPMPATTRSHSVPRTVKVDPCAGPTTKKELSRSGREKGPTFFPTPVDSAVHFDVRSHADGLSQGPRENNPSYKSQSHEATRFLSPASNAGGRAESPPRFAVLCYINARIPRERSHRSIGTCMARPPPDGDPGRGENNTSPLTCPRRGDPRARANGRAGSAPIASGGQARLGP